MYFWQMCYQKIGQKTTLGGHLFSDRMLCKCIILGTMPITQTNTWITNPLTLNIKEQIVLSFPHTFLIKVLGRRYMY